MEYVPIHTATDDVKAVPNFNTEIQIKLGNLKSILIFL
jgi:hypothetical protein